MKKLLVPLVVGMMALPATAAQMECFIDTPAYDEWQTGSCYLMEYTMDYNPNSAVWRVTGMNKPVSSILWSEATAGCTTTQEFCIQPITPYQTHLGKATILYTDGNWEMVQAPAYFETGF